MTVRELVMFAMFGPLMLVSKIIMEALPNIHLLGMFTIVFTVVFRWKALIPIYIYVFLNGLIAGFNVWWFPYLYIWTILWGMTMILPKRMPRKVQCVVYPIVCGLHGFAFGALYAPAHAIMFNFDLDQTLVWITAGLPFDAIHGVSNVCAGLLIVPMTELLRKLLKNSSFEK